VTNIRISLTQTCDQNCLYCHQEGQWAGYENDELPTEKVIEIIEVAKSRGVEKVKFTGGEPLLRPDLEEIISKTSPRLKDVSITTNGTQLAEKAQPLYEAGLDRVNVSLDSLDPETYRSITGGAVDNVVEGIDAAVKSGLYPVKVNVVALRGVNDEDNFKSMIEFAKEKDVIVQFIELLDTGEPYFEKYHHDLIEVERSLAERAEDIRRRQMHNRAKYFFDGAEVEVVRPVENADFCRNCTRLRVTSDGKFKPCLMRSDNLVDTDGDVESAFLEAVKRRAPYCE